MSGPQSTAQPLGEAHCRAELRPGSGVFCGRHKGHETAGGPSDQHRQRSADGGAVWPVEAAEWQPPIGRLYVRHLLDADRYEVELCFATGHSPTGSVDYAQLARITRWQAGPYFGGGIDCAKGQRDHTGAGGMVVRWMAYDNDLAAFVRLWADDRTTVGAWALQAAAVAGLDAGDASRLLRVMAAAKGGAS